MERFTCKMCNFEEEFEDSPIECPACGRRFYRITFLKESGAKTNSRWGANHPRWSWSMGINVSEIPKMMKQFPNRKYNPVTGQLLVENRTCKKRLMKEHGYEEF